MAVDIEAMEYSLWPNQPPVINMRLCSRMRKIVAWRYSLVFIERQHELVGSIGLLEARSGTTRNAGQLPATSAVCLPEAQEACKQCDFGMP